MRVFADGRDRRRGPEADPAADRRRDMPSRRSCGRPRKRPPSPARARRRVSVGLFDRNALDAAVRRHDAVVNLATHIPSSSWKMLRRSAWAENDRIRREASSNLVDAAIAAGVSRFVQESFAPVYPDRGDQWIDEDVPIEPVCVQPQPSSMRSERRRASRRAAGPASFCGSAASTVRTPCRSPT